ncbi:MAG: 30S ribosomal protein S16 [Candidatus Magasanikbacteria bacterium]
MLVIRLQRLGKKKRPVYRVIVSEKTKDTQAGSLEILGQYGPQEQPKIIKLNADRIKYWISQGAQPSETMNNLLISEGVIEGKKQKSVAISNKRQAKMDENNKAKTEAKKDTAEKAKVVEEKSAQGGSDSVGEVAPVEEVKIAEEVKEEIPEEKPKEEKKDE